MTTDDMDMDVVREEKIHKIMKHAGFEISANKYWIWFKRGNTRMDIIDTKKMSCYAYDNNTPTNADTQTERVLQMLIVKLDKKQTRLFDDVDGLEFSILHENFGDRGD